MIRRVTAALAALLALPFVSSAQTSQLRLEADAAVSVDGPALYRQRCADCHGRTGRGDGPFAGLLDPRPRDFSVARFKFRTTETGSLPTDDDLAGSITNGLHGTSMPSWKPFLTPGQVTALVAQVKSFSPRFASERPRPITIGAELPASPANIQAGRGVYEKLRCAAC